MIADTLELVSELVRRESVTPDDQSCQALICNRLEQLGFNCEHLRFGDVDNLWATHGQGEPLMVFAGHTDVVPSGPIDAWASPPFVPTLRDGKLYGRGTADMKSSIAAFVTAIESFMADNPDHKGTVGLLITSDEEGPAIDGTVKVMEHLNNQDIHIDYCIVGEPSSSKVLGDTVKVGRRGSLNGYMTIHGTQGHVAYPHLADNPIHKAVPALTELSTTEWDQGNEFFPPTTFQVSNLNSGTGAENIIPGDVSLVFNFRFSSELTEDELRSRTTAIFDRHGLSYSLDWRLSGNPFLTRKGKLVKAVQQACRDVLNIETELSTSGGTSDGRFIAPTGTEVVELGPCNGSIHQIDEHVDSAAPEQLARAYHRVLKLLLQT
ncbi:MAG TPA: succinyl-diaminopimelate desuccinylase [Gammaproteobacteria bacterium]|nr:succinyl-diaminopimelate desuccinylase [Gammaproteobacteria bacterium]